MQKYDPKVTPWQINEQDFPRDEDSTEKLKFLLRYAHQVTYFPEPGNEELAAVVRFTPREQTSAFRPMALFEAIIARHSNRPAYQARSIPPEDLQRLHDCCA